MKKYFLFLLCSLPFLINAQQFRYGAHISPAASWLDVEGDLYTSSGSQFGVQIGLIGDLSLGKTERFAISSGISYDIFTGGFTETKESNNVKEWDLGAQSVDVPITLRLRSDQLNKTVLYAQYGVNFGFTLGAKVNGDKMPYKGLDYEGLNTSLTMGLGLEHAMDDDKSLLFCLFFQNGIKNVLLDNANDDNMYPQQLGLRIGLLM